jgi:hypothetical protein
MHSFFGGHAVALGALSRCAQLLDEMAEAGKKPLGHLMQLALRPVLETAVAGCF